MGNYRFTIITVCYNAEKCIGETVASVLDQTYSEFEYIIKDGESKDGTIEIVRRLTEYDDRVRLIQGEDEGIYDAMNKAVNEATGEYILFMNAGDQFADKDVLSKVNQFLKYSKADILYGDVLESDGGTCNRRTYSAKNCRLWYYSLGACLCHQAMFCKRKLFEDRLFNLEYVVCADREWQMWHIRRGATAKFLGFPIAVVLTDGFSKNHITELEKETRQCIKLYCGGWYSLYVFISFVKRNKVIHNIIQKAEKLLSKG